MKGTSESGGKGRQRPAGFGATDAFWRSLFDAHPDPVMFLDCDFRVVYANEAQIQALGCAAEEVEGRFCHEVLHGNASRPQSCPCGAWAAEGREQTSEVMFERLLGGTFLVTLKPVFDASGKRIGLLHVARDITASKILESELRGACDSFGARVESRTQELHNRLRFDRLLAVTARRLDPAVSEVAISEMIQVEVGRAAETLGFDRCTFWESREARLRALACCDRASAELPRLPDEAVWPDVPALFKVAVQSGYARAVEAGVVRCAAGKSFPGAKAQSYVLLVECRVNTAGCGLLYEDALRLLCEMLAGVMRRAAEAADMRLLRQELVHADRVARTGQLAAALAHELNQPLMAALCNAQAAVRLLAQEPPDLTETRVALQDIVEAARRASAVMQETRTLYAGGFVQRQPVDLNLTVQRVLALVRSDVALAGVTVKTALDPALLQVAANETQLQQVVRNLLVNAFDAVCERAASERVIVVRTELRDAATVELSVRDSGAGIAPGMEEKIFAPFCTTKSQGHGMGLSICLQIVRNFGGTIRAERPPEGGALFRVALPVSREAAEPPAGSDRSSL